MACTLPTAASDLVALPHPVNSVVALYWSNFVGCGSNIDGYVVTRDGIVIAVIPYSINYYEDSSSNLSTTYEYVVYAFNFAGVSGASNTATFTPNLTYLVTENSDFIVTENNDFIVV